MKVLWSAVFNQLYLKPLKQVKKKGKLFFVEYSLQYVEFQIILISQS
jgi:hypothetical protein